MDAQSIIFHERFISQSPTPIFAYGSTWARWLAEGDQRALILIANVGPITDQTRATIERSRDEPLAILSSPGWADAICVPIDPVITIPDNLKELSICLFQESNMVDSYAKTVVDLEPIIKQEMRQALAEVDKDTMEACLERRYPEYLKSLISAGEINHADARLRTAHERNRQFIPVPVDHKQRFETGSQH